MNRFIKFTISLVVGLVVFLIIMQKVGLEHIGQAFSLFFNFQGLVIVLITSIFIILGIIRWRMILKEQGHSLSFKQIGPLWLIGFSMSYLTPFAVFGGEIFRIYFFRKKFPEIPPKKAMASVAIDRLLDITVFFAFLLIGLLTFVFYGRLPTSFLGVGTLITAFFFICLLGVFYFKSWKKESVLEWLINLFGLRKRFLNGKNGEIALEAEKEVFKYFSLKKKRFWLGLSFSVLKYCFLFLRTIVLVFFLTGSIEILKSLAVHGFSSLAGLTPLPATLGALELTQGFVFRVLGFGFNKGTVFSMLFRGADLLICLIGLFFLIKYTIFVTKDKVFKFFER